MAYQQNPQDHNPYTGNHYGSPPQQQQQYRNEFNEGYGGYQDTRTNDPHNDGPYDPYGGYNAYNNHQPHQTYDQGGYNQYVGAAPHQYDVNRSSPSLESVPPVPPSKEISANSTAYEHDDLAQARPRGGITGSKKSFKAWRADGQENLWTRGTRTRTCGRFFCCTIMITAFLIISIILSLALWIKPPNITIGNPAENDTQAFTLQGGELSFNLAANITVDNPNYFGVALNKVQLDLIYPVDSYPVGGGVKEDINIKSNAQTNFTFPFSFNYNISDTSGTGALQDILAKCRAKQNLKVNYELKLSLRIVVVSISPTISDSFTIGCPVDADQIEKILGGGL